MEADWKPIESAPKDGTPVVLAEWTPHAGWEFIEDHWRTYFGAYGEGFGWVGHEPTHWMPLPHPPKEP